MKCQVCGRDVTGACLCGYCIECIKRFTHEGCERRVKEKQNDKM